MVEYKEGERKSVKGLSLFTVEYHPSTGQPKAALVFHHGLGEYIGRYKDGEEVAVLLLLKGYLRQAYLLLNANV